MINVLERTEIVAIKISGDYNTFRMQNPIHSIYYVVKPYLPRFLLIKLRRRFIRKMLKRPLVSWPVDPLSARSPENWWGWPENKEFALVLTHDVESSEGLTKCRQLMDIEESLGFRSSFNFVIEDYEVPEELRKEIAKRGFEAGIHGLTHRGNPFRSEKVFKKQAEKINRVLKEWGAAGFRAPSMYHDLRLLHYLEIEYDSSTFDVDPFEPQPDGLGTIFPAWVYNEELKKGYVELPYTVPQDHLIFLILGEKNIDIWRNKVDWIAAHGGMALLNTHPDYMSFDDAVTSTTYPAKYYQELLLYIKEKYQGKYWNPLPRELARFWKENSLARCVRYKKKLHVAMPVYSFYESDNRVRRYAKTLAEEGHEVDVICLKSSSLQPSFEVVEGVKVHRLQTRRKNERCGFDYLIRQTSFLIKSARHLLRLHKIKKFDLIHVHSIPDFEVFAALFQKLQKVPVILDIHDLVPELYLSKFQKEKDLYYKALLFLEKISCRFSDRVIIANHLWQKRLLDRSVAEGKCSVIMNYPDETIFYPRERKRNDNKFIIIYPGTLAYHQGVDIAIKAVARLRERFPQMVFHIYGDGPARPDLQRLVEELGVIDRVTIFDTLPLEQIAAIMAEADLGIVPKRDDEFAGEAFSTKILEFMAVGVPVVVSRTRIDSYYFNERVVKFFRPDDVDDLEVSLAALISDKQSREQMVRHAFELIEKYKWSKNKDKYIEMVRELTKQK